MNREEQRFQAAAMAMQGQVSNAEWIRYLAGLCEADGTIPAERIASHSVEYADALLAALYPAGDKSVVRESLTTPATYGGWRPCAHCGKPVVNNPPPWGFPTMGGEHHSGDATEKVPDPEGWIEHRPGDAMPCAHDLRIAVETNTGLFREGRAGNWLNYPSWWDRNPVTDHEIIAWMPAK
jgi:hypothetical protein